jgi:hypothetical protein
MNSDFKMKERSVVMDPGSRALHSAGTTRREAQARISAVTCAATERAKPSRS